MNCDVYFDVFVPRVGWKEREELNVSPARVARLQRSRIVAIRHVAVYNDLWEPRENVVVNRRALMMELQRPRRSWNSYEPA